MQVYFTTENGYVKSKRRVPLRYQNWFEVQIASKIQFMLRYVKNGYNSDMKRTTNFWVATFDLLETQHLCSLLNLVFVVISIFFKVAIAILCIVLALDRPRNSLFLPCTDCNKSFEAFFLALLLKHSHHHKFSWLLLSKT